MPILRFFTTSAASMHGPSRLGAAIACAIVLSLVVAGCRLWDPNTPGGKSAKLSGFRSVPRQSEPVIDATDAD
jgi:hypothetical protein